jgi:class 3 adenylate cyclase
MTGKTITYLWQWQLKSSPAALWPYVADTHRFNQATSLPAIAYTELPLETGGSQRIARTTKLGITVEYEDFPFDWIREQEFSNLRLFKRGPLARTYAKVRLEANGAGTLLSYYVEVVPANLVGFLGILYQFGWEMRRNFERVFRQIDEAVQNQISRPFPLRLTPLSRAAQVRLTNMIEQLSSQGYEARWVQRLADLLVNEADLDLVRMRPYVLADVWHAPRRTILEMFLSAAKIGLLNMRWDILCPLCRGAKLTASSLDEARKGVHCPTCNIDFESDFSNNVELTFRVHPQIRDIQDNSYCVGGPMTTPHILIHQTLQPGETRTLPVKLETGGYRLRTQRPGVEQWLDIQENKQAGETTLFIQAEADTIQVKLNQCPSHQPGCRSNTQALTLKLSNNAPFPQRIYIERADWYTDAATALQVTTLQHFRDLFSDEVLRPGEEIGVEGVTILFSDLVGSTAMYNRRGDALSYALVREQFAFLQRIIRQYDGAIVKTIGDAIMAAFADPAQGVGAALAIQNEIQSFNTQHPDEPLRIKLGLHYGPCIAVNLNGRLDYFGTTVNLASRLEGQSQGGDIVISKKLREDPAVENLLMSLPIEISKFTTPIKGFDENFQLYRLKLAETQ